VIPYESEINYKIEVLTYIKEVLGKGDLEGLLSLYQVYNKDYKTRPYQMMSKTRDVNIQITEKLNELLPEKFSSFQFYFDETLGGYNQIKIQYLHPNGMNLKICTLSLTHHMIEDKIDLLRFAFNATENIQKQTEVLNETIARWTDCMKDKEIITEKKVTFFYKKQQKEQDLQALEEKVEKSMVQLNKEEAKLEALKQNVEHHFALVENVELFESFLSFLETIGFKLREDVLPYRKEYQLCTIPQHNLYISEYLSYQDGRDFYFYKSENLEERSYEVFLEEDTIVPRKLELSLFNAIISHLLDKGIEEFQVSEEEEAIPFITFKQNENIYTIHLDGIIITNGKTASIYDLVLLGVTNVVQKY